MFPPNFQLYQWFLSHTLAQSGFGACSTDTFADKVDRVGKALPICQNMDKNKTIVPHNEIGEGTMDLFSSVNVFFTRNI